MTGCNTDECDCSSICGWTTEQPTSAPSTESTSDSPTSETTSESVTTATSTSTDTQSTSETTSTPVEEHVTVLCLSPVGLYKGAPGEKYGVYENCVLYKEPIGTELPKAADVTSTSGAIFTAWVSYENDGVPSVFTVVPNENYKVLYAQFSGGGGSTSTTETPGPVPTDTWVLYFQAKPWWQDSNAETYIHLWGSGGDKNREFPGEPMNFIGNDQEGNKIYSYVVLSKYIGLVISRVDPNDHSNVWNSTKDLLTGERGTHNAVWADPGDAGWFTYTA